MIGAGVVGCSVVPGETEGAVIDGITKYIPHKQRAESEEGPGERSDHIE